MSEFFIERPVFAAVCAIVIVLTGAIALPTLPVAQYPPLGLPQVRVVSSYVGANAELVESAVTTPLEQAINGVEGMRYIQSSSRNNGSSVVTVTFNLERDIDVAAVDVQNRVNQVLGRLPAEVRATGVSVVKNSTATVFAAALYCEHNEYSTQYISNYIDIFVKDALKRIKGVGNVDPLGERRYSMRLWLDPARLAARGLTAGDVVRALREQNVQIAAGQLGQEPAPAGQTYQISVRAVGRPTSPAQFGQLILKTGDDGTLVQLGDVGRVELGAESYNTALRLNGRDAAGFVLYQLPNANALDVDREARAVMARLAQSFPPGLKYVIAFDPTTTVRDSIGEVLETLAATIALVIVVIFLFVQSWRATLVPALTIPVSLVGTLAFVKLFGFTINTLTLFGLTLAAGLVVDDAIVVVENIERHFNGHRRSGRGAAMTAMAEVGGAVVATSVVLVAVFVPVAMLPGVTGQLYKQFALTIAVSIALSAFTALTLAPALTVRLLEGDQPRPGRIFALINRALAWLSRGYERTLAPFLARPIWVVPLVLATIAATLLLARRVPTGFIPDEEQGYIVITVQGPPGAALQKTMETTRQVEEILRASADVTDVFNVNGFGFGGLGSNKAIIWVSLRPMEARRGPDRSASGVVEELRPRLGAIKSALVTPFLPPPVDGVGDVGGLQLELQDRGGLTSDELASLTRRVVEEAGQQPSLSGLFSGFTANDPQVLVEIDAQRARMLGVPLDEIASTLQIYLGSTYVNDFDLDHRPYRVVVQADGQFRSQPQNIKQFYVRSNSQQMIPLDAVTHLSTRTAPQTITHYNLFRSSEIAGSPAPGFSSGQALRTLEEIASRVLPEQAGYEWSGLSLEQLEAGAQLPLIFALAALFVYLALASQYESFSVPFIIVLAAPLAIFGALLGQWMRSLPNDVFCQIGMIMLIGLASKNAILIVEFAEQLRRGGRSVAAAALESARVRLRPILMTSLAFILGIAPLVVAEGAGANSRRSLGTTIFGGMIASTLLNLYFIPALYVALQSLLQRRRRRRNEVPRPIDA